MQIYFDYPKKRELLNTKWCHLVADDLNTLHEFALKLGLKREWFQNKHNRPHYDFVHNKIPLALKLGAKQITDKELVIFLREKYQNEK